MIIEFRIKKSLNYIQGILLLFCFLLSAALNAQVGGFEPNQGQYYDQKGQDVPHVKYVFKAEGGLQFQLRDKGFSYELFGKYKNEESQSSKSTTYLVHRIDMDFFQPTKQIGIEGIQAYSGYHNYYTRGKRIEKVPHYQSVLYTNVWNQIDMSYDAGSNCNQIKYEFRLHKGSKLSDIQFEVKGSDKWYIEENDVSELVIETSVGKIRDRLPFAYVIRDGQQHPVKVSWKRLPNGNLGFETSSTSWVTEEEWVIDPEPLLIWATYYGGSNSTERSTNIVIDSSGNPFYTGIVNSSSLATTGVYQTTYKDKNDAFVMGVDREGTKVLWFTYFGDTGIEESKSIAIDKRNHLYICGSTNSFKSIAFKSKIADSVYGGMDAFIAKFDNYGKLVWSTYVGDSADDIAQDLKVVNNKLYVVGGSKKSSNQKRSSRISTSNLNNTGGNASNQGDQDGFFLQLDTNGTRRFGAFYGGGNSDYFTGIDVLKSGRIAIVGTTQSPNLAKNFSSGYGSKLMGYNQTTNTTNSDILFMVLSNANILQTVRYLGGK